MENLNDALQEEMILDRRSDTHWQILSTESGMHVSKHEQTLTTQTVQNSNSTLEKLQKPFLKKN